jgi:hypothetical protein
MTYHLKGLGQTASEMVTLTPGAGGGVARLQAKLIEYRMLSMRAPDGRIDSSGSRTLEAIRTYASRNSLSASGLARTSSGGLTIPRQLNDAILTAEMYFTEGGGGASSGGGGAAKGGGSSDAGGGGASAGGSGGPPWAAIAIAGGSAAALLIGLAVYARRRG